MNHYHNTITVSGDPGCQRGLLCLVAHTEDRNFKFLREKADRQDSADTTVWGFITPITNGSNIASDISAVYPTLNVHIKYQDPNMGIDGHMIFEDGELVEYEDREMYEE